LEAVTTVCGQAPEEFRHRIPLDKLTAIDPTHRFRLADSDDLSMRIIDLVAPIGRGTRGLIVAPPKAGKTSLLMSLSHAIRSDDPSARILCLLIDERPEEVTHFRRSVDAEVLASSKDHSPADHVNLAQLTLAHVRTELECGHHVVVLIDSLTRMARAFNVQGSRTGRTMSGGLEAGVLEIPRRFFGLARNIEGGGSVTIIATALIETGSRMDELIFQEFKGTGNSEIVLDRGLAESRIFPAIDITASGTRKEALLYEPDEERRVWMIRKALAGRKPANATQALIRSLEQFPSNQALLETISVD
jgi:transcription termination factor Rho